MFKSSLGTSIILILSRYYNHDDKNNRNPWGFTVQSTLIAHNIDETSILSDSLTSTSSLNSSLSNFNSDSH